MDTDLFLFYSTVNRNLFFNVVSDLTPNGHSFFVKELSNLLYCDYRSFRQWKKMLFTVDTSIGGTVLQDLPFRSSEAIVSLQKFVLADTIGRSISVPRRSGQ